MTPEQIRGTLESACAADAEVAIEDQRGEVGYYAVIELRAASVLLLLRGSVLERPNMLFSAIAAVRILPGEPSIEAIRRLHAERVKAHERKAWAERRDEQRRQEWKQHEEPKG